MPRPLCTAGSQNNTV